MIARFHEHRTEFEQLRAMLQRDSQVRFISATSFDTTDWSGSTSQISPQQLAKYRALMQQLGLSAIVRLTSRGGYFRFEVFGGGFTDTSWGIGYAWGYKPLTPLVQSAYNQMPRRDRQHFSPIEGHWYIYHRR